MPIVSRLRGVATKVAVAATGAPGSERLVGALERVVSWPHGRLAVLTYHRVAEPDEEPDRWPGLISATPAAFTGQAEMLGRHFRVVSIDDVLAAWRGERALPPRAVHLTFDDAYSDFAEHAWPVLRRIGLPATLFVPTAYPGNPGRFFWWDRLHAAFRRLPLGQEVVLAGHPFRLQSDGERRGAVRALRDRLKDLPHEDLLATVERVVAHVEQYEHVPLVNPVLGWDSLAALAADGVAVAPHSRTHPLLTRISRADAHEEIAGSLRDLRERLPTAPGVFAYPSGAHDDLVAGLAAAAGYELAFTTQRGGIAVRRSDPHRLARINVGGRASIALLRAQLTWASRTPRARRRGSARGD